MATENESEGLLLIVAGPSGSGKSTLVEQILGLGEFPITFSVSATSRAPRPGEIDGKHYWFHTRDAFEKLREQGEFLEWAEVHGNLYGTPKGPVAAALRAGKWVLLDIDVQGYRQVKRAMPQSVSFFVRTGSIHDYEERLRHRGTESEAEIARRLAQVRTELDEARSFDFQIVNETVAQAVRTFRTFLLGVRVDRGKQHVG